MPEAGKAQAIEPIPPEPFGRYSLVAKLAVGGMGEIYLARTGGEGLTQLVVLKRIRLELAADPQFQQRFLAEARVLLRLQHGAVTPVFDVGAVEGRSYIALEFVDGKDVRAIIQRAAEKKKRVPPALALQIFLRVLDALAYAHRKKDDDERELNLVHRDVSPQNVLVSYEGEVKVIDFGLAKSALSVQRTHPSVMLGKLLYMAPEIAKHDQLDRRADLFSAAVMLHELLAGQHQLAGLGAAELMMRVVSPRFRPLEGEVPGVPAGLDAALAKALVAEPNDRYRTAEEMRAAFLPLAVSAGSDLSPEPVGAFVKELFAADYSAERQLLRQLRGTAPSILGAETARSLELAMVRSAGDGAKTMPFPSIGQGFKPKVSSTGPTVIPEAPDAITPVPVDPTYVGRAPSSATEISRKAVDSAEFVFPSPVSEESSRSPMAGMPTLRPGDVFAKPKEETAPGPDVPWSTDPALSQSEPITDAALRAAASGTTAPSMRALGGPGPNGADAPREHGTELMAALTYNPNPGMEPKTPVAPATSREAARPQSTGREQVAPTEPPAAPPRTRTGEVSTSRARSGANPPKTRTGELRAPRRAMTAERQLATQAPSAPPAPTTAPSSPAPAPVAPTSSAATNSVPAQKLPRSSVATALIGILMGVVLAGGVAVIGWFLLHPH
ncbi:MAG: protein kinase [Deltaproteobacteria bacterium]|nr:protein kinase [Deltaproteobacteria bacterium]